MAQLTGYSQVFDQDTSINSTTSLAPLGTRAFDTSGNEYIYLKGVASTVATDWVTFDEAHVTLRATANAVGRVAIAMAATVASEFGWYQIYGSASGNALSGFANNGNVFLTGTAGSVDDADVAGDAIVGAVGRSAVSGGDATFEISYPYVHNIAID